MTTIVKETPHLFMWFSDGSKIPDGICPLPQNARLNYIKRLKVECAKLLLTKTPVYLVYMGRLLSREQKTLLENLQNDIPNLAVIDYDEVEQNISDARAISEVKRVANSYQKYENLNMGTGSIAELVDFTRLILLYNSKILRDIAQKKITFPLEWREGLVYRDFDVTLEKERMPDIHTTHGYMATLNFLEKVHSYHNHLIKSASGNEDLTQRITLFFNTHIYNLERYQQILRLFINKQLNKEEQKEKQDFILEYGKICHKKDDFAFIFINQIRIENSFLAVNKDQHSLIGRIIEEVYFSYSSYGAVQKHFISGSKNRDYLNEYLRPQILGFNIGNDLTWNIGVKQQHQLEASTPVFPPTSYMALQGNGGTNTLVIPVKSTGKTTPQIDSIGLGDEEERPSSSMNISILVLSGFIATVGISAIAIAFTLLNASTFGTAGLVVASIGFAALPSGMGLFATCGYKNRQTIPDGREHGNLL